MTDQRPVSTTDAGIAAPSDAFAQSVGRNGPLLLQDRYLLQQMAQFNRERVPERDVHAKGGCAYGELEATEDVRQYTKASLVTKGKNTRLLIRFSTVAGELRSADTVRDPRGFAIKFYTDEGNYDLVGNNTPVFFVRDPEKFSDFIHSQKHRADNNLRDNNMQ
jgi:catalase